ncbi:phage tail family protein [Sporolactobacillus nakayamae]|uniref:Phage-related protein n=1 Tax=Sporolactobacillus nakayamae TaxID=269670 RepID=A0A1I2P3V6_9BACL|nr:phage tail family protein [Sporolactobacillus nakayamae]SFG10764.1 Phage-related protein [Sporolactobacillus nakayamae]
MPFAMETGYGKTIKLDAMITKMNGTQIILSDAGIKLRDFNVSAPTPQHQTAEVSGRDGMQDLGTTYGPRKIHCSFSFKSIDRADFTLLRDEIFQLFDSKESFFITENRQPGKRWKVKVDGDYAIDQSHLIGQFEIDLIAFYPYAESVVSTCAEPVNLDSENWQAIGAGLTMEDDLLYEHHDPSFRIWNGGSRTVDPRESMLVIRFSGASDGLTIRNQTTGDIWKYSGSSSSGDQIVLDGVKALKNGASIFSETNFALIRLLPGWNDIEISGASGAFTIQLDFRFLYL